MVLLSSLKSYTSLGHWKTSLTFSCFSNDLEDISISSKSAMQVLQVKFVKTFSINISNTGDTFLRVPDNSDRDKSAVSEDKSARKRGLVGPYVKTTRTINKIDGNHKDTVWHLSTVLGNVKKKNHIFFKKLLWSHFWIDIYKCYTNTFGIVYILIGYLLIMLLWVIFICT
jgi:hypothetical protein